ncbi:MAG: 2-C-methyl-D-erythritol 4-phosphate cytidylyltransferase [Ignavibacteriaceae bacterium]|nr:2-C-methyl-D-erythritol 4-phosphate cytidylyltransferase [Ignavibacteriaceae bacterium]
MKTFVVIPAGGKGLRSGFSAPKQYLKFSGKELIVYTLEVFQKNKSVDEIIIAAQKAYFPLLKRIIKKYNLTKVKSVVDGGKERQDSVYNALSAINAAKDDLIIVHDAARPLLTSNTLNNAISVAEKKGNALVCVKAKDTLINAKETVDSYLERKEVYYVQTPQIFKYKDLMKAFRKAYEENYYGTDESMLVKRLGKKIHIAEGSVLNFKVTTKSDVQIFRRLIHK